jgi:Fur family transcriptional regulator, zinc uptake regulator
MSPAMANLSLPPVTSAYYDQIMACFKRHGAKLTRPRKLVAQTLALASKPLSAYDIRDAIVAEGDSIDVVSVYRILAILEQYHLINRVPSTNQVFRAGEADDCHHQHPVFVCNTCGTAQELPWHGAQQLIADVASATQVNVQALSLELRGQCGSCDSEPTRPEVDG